MVKHVPEVSFGFSCCWPEIPTLNTTKEGQSFNVQVLCAIGASQSIDSPNSFAPSQGLICDRPLTFRLHKYYNAVAKKC